MQDTDRRLLSVKEALSRVRAELLFETEPDGAEWAEGAERYARKLRTEGRGCRQPAREARPAHRWGIVLAGGDGVRLRPLSRFLCGEDRPKQFCPLLGDETLLQQTRERAEQVLDAERVFYSVTRAHELYYTRDLDRRRSHMIVQPANKGTAPAIIGAVLKILELDPDASVAILPCDHYYSSEEAFASALESAFEVAEAQPASVVLMGAQPTAPEVGYGWIELGDTVAGTHQDLHRVKRFQEKPPLAAAERLLRSGSLWNTFIMVGRASAFLDLSLSTVPDLVRTLWSDRTERFSNGTETRIPDWVYDKIATTDFSRQVLSEGTGLLSLPLAGLEWNDLGDPERVISTLHERDHAIPSWAARWRAECARPAQSTVA